MKTTFIPLNKSKYFSWIGIGIALSLGLFFGMMLQNDQQRFKDLQNRFCNQAKLDQSEITELQDLVLKLENVKVFNINELQEYLCGKCRNCVFPKDAKMIKKIFGVEMRVFHEQVKQKIKRAAKK